MTYINFITAAGNKILIDPRKQRSLFWDFQEGLIAESCLDEKDIPYERYRRRRVKDRAKGPVKYSLSIARSVQIELDRLDDAVFAKVDPVILALAERPKPARSKPKHLKWLRGDLRLILAADYPLVYTIDDPAAHVRVLRVGFCRKFTRPR
jgi:mRNA-degrading endonuclease RelE of RelBE toxin-antitoxin system